MWLAAPGCSSRSVLWQLMSVLELQIAASAAACVDEGLRAVQLQEVMVQSMWDNDILSLPHCAAELADDGQLVNLG